MKNQVKSASQSPSPDDITCRDLNGFILFGIPKVPGVNSRVRKAVRKEVYKHSFVKTADLTRSGNLVVSPNARSLRKSSMSFRSFKHAIKELIASATAYEIQRSHSVSRVADTPALSVSKPAYVNDKTRRAPAAVPAIS